MKLFKTRGSLVGPLQNNCSVFALLLPDSIYLDACGGTAFVPESCASVSNRKYQNGLLLCVWMGYVSYTVRLLSAKFVLQLRFVVNE